MEQGEIAASQVLSIKTVSLKLRTKGGRGWNSCSQKVTEFSTGAESLKTWKDEAPGKTLHMTKSMIGSGHANLT